MKTIVYNFNGVMYSSNQMVSLTFYVKLNCIEKFLNKVCSRYEIDREVKTYNGSSKSFYGKKITVKKHASAMFEMMLSLGWGENSEVRDNIHVDYTRFEKSQGGAKHIQKKYSCYNPQNREFKIIGSTPCVIYGKQTVFNGKLYRKFN